MGCGVRGRRGEPRALKGANQAVARGECPELRVQRSLPLTPDPTICIPSWELPRGHFSGKEGRWSGWVSLGPLLGVLKSAWQEPPEREL